MSSELLKMAQILKNNSVHMKDIIDKDNEILENSHLHVSKFVDKLHKENLAMKKFNQSSWMGFLLVGLILFLCIMLFFFTFMVIRTFR